MKLFNIGDKVTNGEITGIIYDYRKEKDSTVYYYYIKNKSKYTYIIPEHALELQISKANNCSNCKCTEYDCMIYRGLIQGDNSFYIANNFLKLKDFYCNQWIKDNN